MSIQKRLLAKTDKSPGHGPNGDCWVWIAACDQTGYGQISINNRTRNTHRIAYEEFVGPIPKGLQVLHRCDNPSCVRIDHLFLGTQKDNMADMAQKGRRGAPRPPSKLSDLDVRWIRRCYANKDATQRRLARAFGVNQSTISLLVNRKIRNIA